MVVVVAIAFISLLFIQVFYVHNIIDLHQQRFSQGVRQALVATARYLVQEETAYFLDHKLSQIETQAISDQPVGDQSLKEGVKLKFITASGLEADLTIKGAADELSNIQGESSIFLGGHYKSMSDAYRESYLYHKGVLDDVVFNIISTAADRPINVRADSAVVAHYLRERLDTLNITEPFQFAVVNDAGDIQYKSKHFDPDETKHEMFTQRLFPQSPNSERYYLKAYFPDSNKHIYGTAMFMVPAFVFTIILIGIFIYTIVATLRERKLSDLKNEFINNMTHEFKTPLSSISLAAQMLRDKDIRKSPQMLQQISQVVNDESRRLRYQVDKVLQMALFEREEVKYRIESIDINALVYGIANTVRLKVESYGGRLEVNLDANNAIVMADEHHFTNVIFNLLDNAIKYRSDSRPIDIVITTRDIDNERLEVEFEDNGIGIRRDLLKRIFDKFYRVSTGNLHNVKGFGLGLAYVKRIVSDFGGTILVDSEVDKGTKFTIILPLSIN